MGRIGLVRAVAGIALGGLVAVAGCDGADDAAASGGDEAALHGGFPFHQRHHGLDAGGGGGGTGIATGGTTSGGTGTAGRTGAGSGDGGAPTDCNICAQAQTCCEVVAPGNPVCAFSAATCSSYPADSDGRRAYVNACLTFLVAARGARSDPPAECR